MHRRFAAAAIAALLLAGCGSATGGRAPSAPKPVAPQAAAPGTAAPKPVAPQTAAPKTAAVQLHSPKEVTLADNGAIVDMNMGGAFTLKLPAPKGWHWKVINFDASMLTEGAGVFGIQGVFRAVKAGTSLLTAEEIPPCGNSCPKNAKGPIFEVTVRVAS